MNVQILGMQVEHHSTDTTVLPRTWWNDVARRQQDLTEAKALLDRQERAWNMMLTVWREQQPAAELPLPSTTPKPWEGDREVIQHFP